jgi:hypothetical protein
MFGQSRGKSGSELQKEATQARAPGHQAPFARGAAAARGAIQSEASGAAPIGGREEVRSGQARASGEDPREEACARLAGPLRRASYRGERH